MISPLRMTSMVVKVHFLRLQPVKMMRQTNAQNNRKKTWMTNVESYKTTFVRLRIA